MFEFGVSNVWPFYSSCAISLSRFIFFVLLVYQQREILYRKRNLGSQLLEYSLEKIT